MDNTTKPPQSPLRQIFTLSQHSAIYAISSLVQKLPGLLLLPVYTNTHYLPSRSAFGDYSLIFTFIAFMYFVYLYGMDSALLRYFFLGGKDRKTVFSSILIMLCLTGLITTVILILFSSQLAVLLLKGEQYTVFIKIAALILFIDSIGNLPFILLRAEENAVKYTLFRILRFVLEFVLNIIFVVFLKKGVLGILYANLAATILNLLFMLPIIFKYLVAEFDFQLAKDMLLFGLPFLPNGIAYVTIETIDRFLVQEFLGKDAVGLYSPNYKFGTLLLMVVIAFRNAWQPFFLRVSKEVNAKQIYTQVLTYFVIAGGFLLLFGTYFIEDILQIHYFNKIYLLGPSYWAGIPLIPIILLSYYFFGIYVVLTPGFYIRKKSGYMIIFTGSGAVVNILANILLLPRLNIWGAAFATLLSYLTLTLTIYIASNKIYPIKIEWERVIKMLVLILLFLSLYYALNLSLVFRIILIILSIIYGYFIVLNKRERAIIQNKFVVR
jgi:O-antigen/teichoic acid export membrane protein